MKKIMVVLTSLMLLLVSCSDPSSADVNYTQEVTNSLEQMQHFTTELKKSKGVEAIEFLSNNTPFDAKTTQGIIGLITKYYNVGISQNHTTAEKFLATETGIPIRFPFKLLCGVYEFNIVTGSWAINPGGDAIILKFATPGLGNCELIFSKYEDTLVEISHNGKTHEMFLPTELYLELVVTGTKLLSFDFSATYGANGIPTQVELEFFVNPYVMKIKILNREEVLVISTNFNFGKKELFSSKIIAEFTDVSKKEIVKLTISFTVNEVKFEFIFDMKELVSIINENGINNMESFAELLNKNVIGKVYHKGKKIGEISFEMKTYTLPNTGLEVKLVIPYITLENGDMISFIELIQSWYSFFSELVG